MTKRCLRCGGPHVVDGHHVLGRGAGGRYVEPEIVAALCAPSCHQGGIHQLLLKADLDGPRPATPGVLVGRIGCFLGWLAWPKYGELDLPEIVEVTGGLLADIADVLGAVSRELLRNERGAA